MKPQSIVHLAYVNSINFLQGVSVEAVDPVFQAKMLDMLRQTGRPEMVVGWYHSHPGFGCWLSGVDINTQQSFEALSERAVAVVVDPIQSVKGIAD
jgi:26S proteasome regulatory subunit N11